MLACNRPKHQALIALIAALASIAASALARAADSAAPATSPSPEPATKSESKTPKGQRNFYQVLEDLMGDFEYDLKNGQVSGLKDLSVRNIAVSENVPGSFRTHLDLAVTERIMRNSNTRVIQCLPCRSKKTLLSGDQMVISSAETNPVELSRIAKASGIQNFMDIAFAFQPSGMSLSMTISSPETGAIVWSRSYNSETSRTAAIRRGVDFSQTDDARKQTEYTPTLQYRLALSYMFEPELSGSTGCLALGFRMMERYDNRRKEVGAELSFMKQASSIIGGTPSVPPNLWSGFNLTALFLHHWNSIAGEENFNLVRGSFTAGIGGTYASGYLGGLFRVGYEWRLGKHWSASTNLGYRPSATRFIGSTSLGSMSGLEFGVGVGALF